MDTHCLSVPAGEMAPYTWLVLKVLNGMLMVGDLEQWPSEAGRRVSDGKRFSGNNGHGISLIEVLLNRKILCSFGG
jgi:hypothetical protein